MKKLVIEIQLEDYDTKEDAYRLSTEIMTCVNDVGYGVASIHADDKEVYRVYKGFDKDFVG